jgi:hypothetical protein
VCILRSCFALREGRMLDHETVVAAFNRLTATNP